jgi:hypothetical protein
MVAESLFNERNKVDQWTLKAPALNKLGGTGIELCSKTWILNPYEGINWKKVVHIKAALHTHTANSLRYDKGAGNTQPGDLIKAYEDAGFDAVVITDHDYISGHNSDLPSTYGNELSMEAEHILSYGTTYEDKSRAGYDNNLAGIAIKGGIAYLAHPNSTDKPNEWWLNKIVKYPHAKGIEVFNARYLSRHGSNEHLWDCLLSKMMPDRNVFGISADDNHSGTKNLSQCHTTVLLTRKQLCNEGLLDALNNGTMYFTVQSDLSKPEPKIHSIVINNDNESITVTANNATKIEWIANGKVVHTVRNNLKHFTTTFYIEGVESSYVRFRLTGEGGQTYSQPFGLRK